VRAGRIWIAVWLASYFLLSLPAIARPLHVGLASAYPPLESPVAMQSRAVIVLSGGADYLRTATGEVAVPSRPTLQRIAEAVRVYRMLDAPLVIASGGSPNPGDRSEAEVIHDRLVAAGVPAERILLESGSRDTRESASRVRALLEARQMDAVVLVTSALHMPRAMRAFRSEGVNTIAAPASGRLAGLPSGWRAMIPDANALVVSEASLHEYAGIVYYLLRGWA
jgi:uncharacterized SAM-binding protein YcdF (DUF218 family)